MKCKGNDLKIFILFYGCYWRNLSISSIKFTYKHKKNACTYIYHKRKKTHKKPTKSITFAKKTPKNRLFCVTFT